MVQYTQQEAESIIRQMESRDLEQVCRIEKENFTDPWTVNGFRDAISGNQTCFLVMEENGRMKGYCGAYIVCDEAEIVKVSVDSEFQNQKIATKLLMSLFRILQTRNITSFTLEVRAGNVPAIALYHKLGFHSEGIRPKGYEHPREDAVIMWKR